MSLVDRLHAARTRLDHAKKALCEAEREHEVASTEWRRISKCVLASLLDIGRCAYEASLSDGRRVILDVDNDGMPRIRIPVDFPDRP